MPSPHDILLPGGQSIGAAGAAPEIREIQGGQMAADAMFHDLTVGATPFNPSSYPGRGAHLPGGGWVGLRPASKSGPPTIDVNIPGIPIRKIKFL